MKEKLQYVPITLYSIIMGLTGLAIALSKFAAMNWLPESIYIGVLYFSSSLFIIISLMYIAKVFIDFNEAKTDFRHRIRINFFSAISISLLLLSIAYHPINHSISLVLWWVGVVSHTFIMLHTIAFWIQHNFEIHTFNPAWFIPVVGNIIIPIMGVEYMSVSFSFFYFAIGAFFWIILFAIFLNRVIFHDQLPTKFIPTLFILIAPPAIGFISYYKITQQWDLFAEFLINIAYFFVILLIFLFKSFKNIKFFISWWAFTFPLDAITIASVLAYQITKKPIYMYASWVGLTLAIIFIVIVTYKTIGKIRHGEICIKED